MSLPIKEHVIGGGNGLALVYALELDGDNSTSK